MHTQIATASAHAAPPRHAGAQGRIHAPNAAEMKLLGRVAKGDKSAMHTLYVQHRGHVQRFVARLIFDEAFAEDLVSEIFIEVWRSAGRFEGRCRVSTWILAIARLKALSALRRRKDDELDEIEAAEIPDASDNPEICAEKKDRCAVLRRCIDHLSPDHREIIDLVYYQDKNVNEVAEIIAVPRGTVKTRMFYARKEISKLLAEAGVHQLYQ